MRGSAETVGEWTFYAAVVLIALALIHYFPYRLFYKTHRLLAVAYLALVFHAVVLIKFSYAISPVGWLTAALLGHGTWAAAIVLLRRIGANRPVKGRIVSLRYYSEVRALETEIEVPRVGQDTTSPVSSPLPHPTSRRAPIRTLSLRHGIAKAHGFPSSPRN